MSIKLEYNKNDIISNKEILNKLTEYIPQALELGAQTLNEQRIISVILMHNLISKQQLQKIFYDYKNFNDKAKLIEVIANQSNLDPYTLNIVSGLSFGIPYVKLEYLEIEAKTLSLLPAQIVKNTHSFPFKAENDVIWIAIGNINNLNQKNNIIDYLKAKYNKDIKIEFALTDYSLLTQIINSRYSSTSELDESDDSQEDLTAEEEEELGPARDTFNRLLEIAVDKNVSDIHIEADSKDSKGLQVRMRIDGDLQIVDKISERYAQAVITVLKLAFGMNMIETRKSQSGNLNKNINNKNIDFRGETLATVDSEDFAIRILDKSAMNFDLNEMGMSEHNLKLFKAAYNKPYGSILITGPTSSGKSTTLYSVLKELNDDSKKIITIEDPVEYRLKGLRQVQVDERESIQRTFPNALRSILRQNPNIIMVGEIRDPETAKISMRAAQTGHLVLSTIHTQEAASAPAQLNTLEVPNYIVADALRCIVAQRLIKILCPHCKIKYIPTDAELHSLLINNFDDNKIKQVISSKEKYPIYKSDSRGCNNCVKGYLGRTAVHEILTIDEEISELIRNNQTSVKKIRDTAIKNSDMHTMQVDGIYKIFQGITSIEEVKKATSM